MSYKLKTLMEKFGQLFFRKTESGKMEVNKRTVYWTAGFAIVLVTFLVGHFYKSSETSSVVKTVPVEVETVMAGPIKETIELTGWMKANKIVEVRSKVPGRIESLQTVSDGGGFVDVEEGLAVKKGQAIAVIDHEVYLAEVASAEANLRAREVELADAEREKKRIVALYEGGSATEQNKDKAITVAALAEARLSSAGAGLELAKINLRESTIVSPIGGIVTAKHIDQGNLIKAGDRIVTVADMKMVKVIAAVAEKYGGKIHAGTAAEIKVDAFGQRIFETKVYSVYPTLDEQTRMVQIEIRLDNGQLLLKPGMFARVTLITNRKDNVVVVGRDVVLGGRISDEYYVYVVEEAVARKRFVKIGIAEADKYEISEGLKAGEVLVVNGMHYLTDGIGVEIVQIGDVK